MMMMPETNTTEAQSSAIHADVLELIRAARSNTLRARRITEEIENIEEMSMADLMTIARACSASLAALSTLETKLKGDEPQPPQPPAAAVHTHLSVVDAIAA
jgi:hypothetical protein